MLLEFQLKINKFLQNRIVVRILKLCILSIVILYIYNQAKVFISRPLKTEVAYAVSTEHSIDAECYILRDEIVLTTNRSGIVMPTVKDGERVAKGEAAVKIYLSQGDVEIENRIADINEKIKVLENSDINKLTFKTEPAVINSEIRVLVDDSVTAVSKNNLSSALTVRDSLLVEMNKRYLYSTSGTDFNTKKAVLEENKKSLESSKGTPLAIVSPEFSGYYYSVIDGYESVFSSDKIDKMTLDSFNAMINSPAVTNISGVCGKLATDYMWYAVTKVSVEEARNFDIGKNYTVKFSSYEGTGISMELSKKVVENDRDEALLVFSSSILPEDFDFARKQQIKLVYNSYSGLKIPKEAVRVINGSNGVYVSTGTNVIFKLIKEIYTGDDYYIVDMNKKNYPFVEKEKHVDESGVEKITYYPVISLYDSIVIDSDKIYDGMEIE